MTGRARPAAYIRAGCGDQDALTRQRDAVADGSRQRGWPLPAVYAEDDADLAAGHAPELARLAAAIKAGRHDALLITEPGAVFGTAPHLLDLLQRCTRNGVTVGFLLPPALTGPPVMQMPAAASPARPPVLLERENWAILARARAEALASLFPGWRIWLDRRLARPPPPGRLPPDPPQRRPRLQRPRRHPHRPGRPAVLAASRRPARTRRLHHPLTRRTHARPATPPPPAPESQPHTLRALASSDPASAPARASTDLLRRHLRETPLP